MVTWSLPLPVSDHVTLLIMDRRYPFQLFSETKETSWPTTQLYNKEVVSGELGVLHNMGAEVAYDRDNVSHIRLILLAQCFQCANTDD